MQMKEVCSRTGLTERTVRFYIEKGLLSPGRSWRNGREYLDFSEGDIRALERIAALRRCFFTLEQIGSMQAPPGADRRDFMRLPLGAAGGDSGPGRSVGVCRQASRGKNFEDISCALQAAEAGSGPAAAAGTGCSSGFWAAG